MKGGGGMNSMRRRDFLPAAGTVAAMEAWSANAQGKVAPPATVTLGNTGIETVRVGLGTGMKGGKRQSYQTRLGFEKFTKLLLHCYDRGVTFFDAADLYGSHIYIREALRSIPRENVTIQTKLWWRLDGKRNEVVPPEYRARSCRTAIERFRQELATDYLDIVLLHCLTDPNWTEMMKPYMEVLSELKEKGQIRAVGVSCHNWGAMQSAVESSWVEVILARINPDQVKMDNTPSKVIALLKKARARGKGVIGMKIYGEGALVHKKEECIRFAQSSGALDAMVVGAISPQEIDETLTLVAKYPCG